MRIEILSEDAAAALQYGPAEGYGPLREWVAQMLRGRGFAASAENVLLTSGSQQALDLTARAFLDRGDAVAIECPTYSAALQVFDSYGANYRQAHHDADGMLADQTAAALSAGCKLLFALPNFQNPSGRTLHHDRRERLAAALSDCETVLLEDDAYYDLRYEGKPLPPIGALIPPERALYSGTFSKTVAPGLRVGYLFGPAPVIERLTHLKQMTDLHTSLTLPADDLPIRNGVRLCRSDRTAVFRLRLQAGRDAGGAALAYAGGSPGLTRQVACSSGSRCRISWTRQDSWKRRSNAA